MSVSRLAQLAESVLNNTKVLDSYLRDHDLPAPSFDADGPTNFGISADEPHVERARTEAIEAAAELADLLQGPMNFLRPITVGVSLHAISRWDIATKVPINGETTFAALAEQCHVHETDMRRLLRYAMVYSRVFCEPRPGVVAHSLASRLLAEEPLLRDGLWLLAEDYPKTAAHTVAALERWGTEPQAANHTALSLANGTDKSAFEYMGGEDPAGREMGRRFALAMSSFTRFPSRPALGSRSSGMVAAYPWADLGSATVVDIGGSRGADAVHLAGWYPELSFVVQDMPAMIEGAAEALPLELRERIRFMPYDFFTPQTLTADVYLIKQCLHNWSDHHCVQILQNLVPALRTGSRLLILDSLVPPPGTMSLMEEKNVRAFDIMMLGTTTGREREAEDWHNILKLADERFKVEKMQPTFTKGDFGPAMGLIEVIWQG